MRDDQRGAGARLEAWVEEAGDRGARVLAGGRRDGALLWPTVLENVPDGVRLDCDEAYGPVVSLYRVRSLEEAIERANRVRYGLHAAIFTESLRDAYRAIRGLQYGAVIVNDSTDYRLDIMPFGGTKLSGIEREGIRFAVLEATETRVVCFNLCVTSLFPVTGEGRIPGKRAPPYGFPIGISSALGCAASW